MKILVIADTHYSYTIEELKKYTDFDFCISLGDVERVVLLYFADYCKNNNIPMYAIPGNHDTWNYLQDIEYIRDAHCKLFKLNDYLCFGFGGSYKYKDYDIPLYSDQESLDIMKKAPKCDILFTHDSIKVKNIFFNNKLKTFLYKHFYQIVNHPGLLGINYYINKNKPKFHFHGHHHVNIEYKYHKTTCTCIYGLKIIEITE